MPWLLALTLVFSPLIADRIGVPIFAVVLGAVLAHEGASSRAVMGGLAATLVAEVVWGVDLGTLSLAYLMTALSLRLVEGYIAFVPLARERGWSAGAMFRSGVAAAVGAIMMSGISVLIQSIVYGHGSVYELFVSLYHPMWSSLVLAGLASGVVLIVVHRIQTPFRRPITFGT